LTERALRILEETGLDSFPDGEELDYEVVEIKLDEEVLEKWIASKDNVIEKFVRHYNVFKGVNINILKKELHSKGKDNQFPKLKDINVFDDVDEMNKFITENNLDGDYRIRKILERILAKIRSGAIELEDNPELKEILDELRINDKKR